MRKGRLAISALIIFLIFPIVSYAETIVLKSGKTVEGKAIEETDKYIKVDVEGLLLTFFTDEIARIDRKTSAPEGSGQNIVAKSLQPGKFNTLQFESVTEIKGSSAPTRSICYIKDGKMRVEMVDPKSGKPAVYIANKGKGYLLFPKEGVGLALSISNLDSMTSMPGSYKRIPGIKLSGEEEIGGELCDVYEAIQEGEKVKMWVSRALDFAIRTEREGKSVTYTKDIKRGISLDDALFEVPSDIKIMSNTGQP